MEQNEVKKKNRKRTILKTFYVNEEENKLIKKKMELAGYDNFNLYAIRMLIDGFIIVEDYDKFIEVSSMLNEIGKDINKIAHRADVIELQEQRMKRGEVVDFIENPISIEDIKRIDQHMQRIWNTLNHILRITGDMYMKETTRKELKKKIREDEEKEMIKKEIEEKRKHEMKKVFGT